MKQKVKKIAPNVTTEQIEQIRRQLSSAVNAYRREVPNRYIYDKAVDGIKYKSSSSDELFITVPRLSQKRNVKKYYLDGIQTIFNQQYGSRYSFHVLTESGKNRVWIPVLAAGLVATAAAGGLAAHFAISAPKVVTVSFELPEGVSIPGHEGETIRVPEGSTIGELPRAVKTGEEDLWQFVGWANAAENAEVLPNDTVITAGMKLTPVFEPANVKLEGGSTTLSGRAKVSGKDENTWTLKHGTMSYSSGITWNLEVSPSSATSAFSINNGLLSWSNDLEKGQYEITIKGSYQDADGYKYEASNKTKVSIADEPAFDISAVKIPTKLELPYFEGTTSTTMLIEGVVANGFTEREKEDIKININELKSTGCSWQTADKGDPIWISQNKFNIEITFNGFSITGENPTISGAVGVETAVQGHAQQKVVATIADIATSVVRADKPTISYTGSKSFEIKDLPAFTTSIYDYKIATTFTTTGLSLEQKSSIAVVGTSDLAGIIDSKNCKFEWQNDAFFLTLRLSVKKEILGKKISGGLSFNVKGVSNIPIITGYDITINNPLAFKDIATKDKKGTLTYKNDTTLTYKLFNFEIDGIGANFVQVSQGELKWLLNEGKETQKDITTKVKLPQTPTVRYSGNSAFVDVEITINAANLALKDGDVITGGFNIRVDSAEATYKTEGYAFTVPYNPLQDRGVSFKSVGPRVSNFVQNDDGDWEISIVGFSYSGYQENENTFYYDENTPWYIRQAYISPKSVTLIAPTPTSKYAGTFGFKVVFDGTGAQSLQAGDFVTCNAFTFVDEYNIPYADTETTGFKFTVPEIVTKSISYPQPTATTTLAYNFTEDSSKTKWVVTIEGFGYTGFRKIEPKNFLLDCTWTGATGDKQPSFEITNIRELSLFTGTFDLQLTLDKSDLTAGGSINCDALGFKEPGEGGKPIGEKDTRAYKITAPA